ncbi:MAG: FtsX-like permease family protein [Acidobacteria bacterium]|nr:FtsX-like permease family protein [Acidobacteriota bacterium]
MSAAEARQEAERRFGDVDAARRALYSATLRSDERLRLSGWFDSLRMDAIAAVRRLRAAPGFTAISVATFALGVGLTTVMFAILDATLLRELPFPSPDRLVSVDEDGDEFPWVSSTNWMDWDAGNRSLRSSALYSFNDRASVATTQSEAARVSSAQVGGAWFETLQPTFVAGRGFTAAEALDREPVVVVSEALWRRTMGADPALGELLVDGSPRTVVGVVADASLFPDRVELWEPASYRRQPGRGRNNINWQVVARLQDGVTAVGAREDLDRIAENIRTSEPEAVYSWGVGVVPLKEAVVGASNDTVWLLMGAVVAVLLVACANLAGHAYARTLARLDTAAVRLALVSTRWRLWQHQLVEHLILALLGGTVGLVGTMAAARWIAASGLPLPRADLINVDYRVALFALLLSTAAGLLAGAVPAWRVARADPGAAMGNVRGASAGSRVSAASVLVSAELALTVLLLIGGGLLTRSFLEFNNRDLGFEPDQFVVAELELVGPAYRDATARMAVWDEILREVRALPGVADAALGSDVPGLGPNGAGWISLADQPEVQDVGATYRVVSDGYFETLGVGVLVGRELNDRDAAGTARVAVINQRFADTYWPGQDPLGREVRAVSMEPMREDWITVVGVVPDLDVGRGVEERPAMYVAASQAPLRSRRMIVNVRVGNADAGPVAAGLRERIAAIDRGLAAEIAPMSHHLGEIVARDRLVATLLSGFAGVALILAAIGVHGLVSFAVAGRTREIAVRAALGANRVQILAMVIGQAMRVAAIGATAGVLLAIWASRALESQFDEFTGRDPWTFVAVAVTLIVVSAIAAWLPARRAVSLDPVDALRAD